MQRDVRREVAFEGQVLAVGFDAESGIETRQPEVTEQVARVLVAASARVAPSSEGDGVVRTGDASKKSPDETNGALEVVQAPGTATFVEDGEGWAGPFPG